MEIAYEFEMEDWMELQKHHISQSKQLKRVRMGATVFFLVAMIGLIVSDFVNDNSPIISLSIYGIAAILWLKYFPRLLSKVQLSGIRKRLNEGDNSGLLGHHSLRFEADVIAIKQPESQSKVNWNGIKKLLESEAHYFLYTSSNSAIVIPKHKISQDLKQLDELFDSKLEHLRPNKSTEQVHSV